MKKLFMIFSALAVLLAGNGCREEFLPPESQTRTVQVSVEQILAGAEQAAAQNEYTDDESEEDFDEPRTAADRAGDMGRSLARWLVLVLGGDPAHCSRGRGLAVCQRLGRVHPRTDCYL